MKFQFRLRKLISLTLVLILAYDFSNAQSSEIPAYPQTVGYMSFIIPFVSVNKQETTTNFSNSFSIGFPVGINIFYSDKFGFSSEITPTIKFQGGSGKMSNLLIDPGLAFRLKKGYAIVTRLAFETSGRYGITPELTKAISINKNLSYFISGSLPVRTGNADPLSLGFNIQVGIIFK